jgi:hypothetical protein
MLICQQIFAGKDEIAVGLGLQNPADCGINRVKTGGFDSWTNQKSGI